MHPRLEASKRYCCPLPYSRVIPFHTVTTQFFESINSGAPSKKRKLEADYVSDSHSAPIDAASESEESEDGDAMPDFHELNEADEELSQEILDDVEDIQEISLESETDAMIAGPSRPRPPVSAPARTMLQGETPNVSQPGVADAIALGSVAIPGRSTKPQSMSSVKRPKRDEGGLSRGRLDAEEKSSMAGMETAMDTHTFPICGKVIETDNQGLNAHVDFCLSRGAIREAQAKAV